VTSTLTTWKEVGTLGQGVLLIVNSRDDNRAEADATFARVCRSSAAPPFVIVPASWRGWPESHGIPATGSLVAEDVNGQALELNHFLGSLGVLRWIRSNNIRVVIGSSPHQLHNYEVKDIFEQRVALFLCDGTFLAHTLPAPYLYIFDLAHLLRRMSRVANTELYLSTIRAMVDDWYSLWRASGSPATADGSDFADVMCVLRQHLGDRLVSADEEATIPLPRTDDFVAVSAFVGKLLDLMLKVDVSCMERDAIAERDAAIAERDVIIEELRTQTGAALALRDATIENLRQALDNRFSRRLRRLFRHFVAGH
jgi:hypothetical protein